MIFLSYAFIVPGSNPPLGYTKVKALVSLYLTLLRALEVRTDFMGK